MDDQAINRTNRARRRCGGVSLVELLTALAITAMLLTATMVAIDASFRAYAAAAESASTQTATRMVINRLLTLLRTSTAHAPLTDGLPTDTDWTTMRDALDTALQATHGIAAPTPVPAFNGTNPNLVETSFLRLIDGRGNDVVVEYIDAVDELWVTVLPFGGGAVTAQPLLGGVTAAQFSAHRRLDGEGVFVLSRGSVDLTVVADDDSTLAVEDADTPPIRVIASTMPRRLN